jgi:hypothetical protein
VNLSMADKPEIKKVLKVHVLMRVKAELDQFQDGLKTCGVLEAIRKNPVQMAPLLTSVAARDLSLGKYLCSRCYQMNTRAVEANAWQGCFEKSSSTTAFCTPSLNTHTHMHTHTHAHTCTRTCTRTHACTHAHTCVHTHTTQHTHTCLHLLDSSLYIHTCTCTHAPQHTHTLVCIILSSFFNTEYFKSLFSVTCHSSREHAAYKHLMKFVEECESMCFCSLV